jgi:hypothetical protein
MKRYVWLLLAGLLASVAGVVVMRSLRASVPQAEAVVAAPTTALELSLGAAGLEPVAASLPKGHRVQLSVRNGQPAPVTLTLQGYEDRFVAGPIAPGATWRGEFLADRPGEAFSWVVAGMPVGQLAVTGSHLEEGHR